MDSQNTEIIIDFSNEKNDKLYFYEKKEGSKVIEYAYIKYKDDNVYYKPSDDIYEHQFPKEHLNEFLLNLTNNITKEKISSRIDLKSKNSKPFFQTRVTGTKIPNAVFLSLFMGFLGTLKFIGCSYKIGKKESKNTTNSIQLRLTPKNDDSELSYINIYYNDMYQEYMLNGFLNWKTQIEKHLTEDNLNDTAIWEMIIDEKTKKSKSYSLKTLKNVLIDKTSAKILKIYGYNPDMLILIGKTMPKKILNDEIDDMNNLSTQRIRMSESIAHVAYNQINQALGTLKKNKKGFDKARLFLTKDFIIKNLQGSGMLQQTRTVNPLEELLLSSKISKTGVGNMKREHLTVQKRDLNESYFGVVAATTTNEYGGIGANQTLTNAATIKDRFGSIMLKEFSNKSNPFDNLSFSESLMPFYEYDDTTRRVMGNQQFTQFVQLDNPDVPLTQTGFEAIVPHIVSDRFAFKAKNDGQVKIEKDYIIVTYKDNSQEIFSTKPTKARTKRGAYLPLEYNILVKNGQKVKKDEVIATTNSLKHGKLAVGKNLVVAEMSYRGMNYEDGWVVTEDISEKYKSKIYDKLTIIIPEGTIVNKLNIPMNYLDKDINTNVGEVLIEYQYNNISSKMEEDFDFEEEAGLLSGKEIQGGVVKYRSPGGRIADVVVKLNSKKVDDKIIKLFEIKKKEIEKKQRICSKIKDKVKQ